MDRAPKVGTLGDLAKRSRLLRLECLAWRRYTNLDLRDLINDYGADTPLQDFIERAVCRKCGARWPQVDCPVGV
jgi:hypothetical protein